VALGPLHTHSGAVGSMEHSLEQPPVSINFAEEERKTLQGWAEERAFERSLELSEGKPKYTFYDGPPFATGLPHYGHILAGTIKDTVTRYAHQTGHHVERRFGWDCHGLPVEYEIDQKLGIKGRDDVLAMGIDKYNAECRSIVTRYTSEWETTVTRLGRWIDFKNDYKTMDTPFMESVWWVFKTLFEKGLVYRGYKVMPFSTGCCTALSNFEAGLNYKDAKDPSITIAFKLKDEEETYALAWTSTPWTLPSNLALCVNPELDYVKLRDAATGRTYIVAEPRIVQLYPVMGSKKWKPAMAADLFTILEKMKGAALAGKAYEPLFPYYASRSTSGAFRILTDGYVTSSDGTGIVHQAPGFGEDDYRVCLAASVIDKSEEVPCPVDSSGRFMPEIVDFAGRYIKDADSDICAALKAAGLLVHKEAFVHSYPFCWRSDSPLIYKAVPSWFVRVEEIKERLLANNEKTYWVPSFVKEKRFHNWLSEARDWAISRARFWGTPIPLWSNEDRSEIIAVGSVEELERLSGAKVTDLHRDYIDDIEIPSPTGKGTLRRIDEVSSQPEVPPPCN
jgi:isoleucyl-tRNA synthetase